MSLPIVIPDLMAKFNAVMTILFEHELVEGSRQNVAAARISQLRADRGIASIMHDGNLSDYLRNKKPYPKDFFNELTTALCLIDLGFDETIWKNEKSEIEASVKLAIEGGVTASVLNHANTASLFVLTPVVEMGIGFKNRRRGIRALPPMPEFVAKAGTEIETTLTLDDDAYVRVVACEEGEFIGLNSVLGIPTGLIAGGPHVLNPIEATREVARTIIYAFASKQPHFREWPVDEREKNSLNHGQFLKLVRGFFSLPESLRVSSAQSFITTDTVAFKA